MFLEIYFSNMYLIVLETINQGTREHRCRYGHHHSFRYGLNCMPDDQRLCESCNVVEDEYHVILHCSLYVDIRIQLFTEISNISDHFPTLPTDVQFLQIMSNPLYYRSASRAMHNILSRRRCSMLR